MLERARPAVANRSLTRVDPRLLLGIAVMAVAALFSYSFLQGRAPRQEGVLVAAHDIAAGAVIAEGDLRVEPMPLSAAQRRVMFTEAQRADLLGKTAQRAIAQGEPILLPDISEAASLSRDQVAVAVPATGDRYYVPYDVKRGDRVIIYATGGQAPNVQTVLLTDQAVVLLVIREQTSGTASGQTQGGRPQSLVLAVPAPLADLITQAVATNIISLAVQPEQGLTTSPGGAPARPGTGGR